MSDLDAVAAALEERPARILWVETPSNPLLKVSDIAGLARLGHAAGALVVVDNTFATPALQQPLALGADVVVHSTTKYLGGHSDVVGGALVTNDAELAEAARFLQFAVGAVSSPFDAWLTTRGIKTLGVRMQRHSENGDAVARFLAGHERVAAVYYPGLSTHPGHDVARTQMSGFGGIVSLALADQAAARRFAESTRLFTLAESLGGVESLVNYPDAMTHGVGAGNRARGPHRGRCGSRWASRTSEDLIVRLWMRHSPRSERRPPYAVERETQRDAPSGVRLGTVVAAKVRSTRRPEGI